MYAEGKSRCPGPLLAGTDGQEERWEEEDELCGVLWKGDHGMTLSYRDSWKPGGISTLL